MTGLYRKKPVPVEARQLLGSEDGQTGRDLAAWCGGSVGGLFADPKVLVPTLEGALTARTGDWIVKGPRGEFWPVKGDIFAETYEGADTPLHAACRAEALNEGAEAIDVKQDGYEAEERKQFGSLDHETLLQGEAVRGMAALLRQMADGEKATVDFFQPGHTYTRDRGFRFTCHAVAPTPWDGTPRAIGYLTHPDGSGHVHGLAAEQWADGDWDDTTDTTTQGEPE